MAEYQSKFTGEEIDSGIEKANTALERFLKLDTLKKCKNSQSSFFLN